MSSPCHVLPIVVAAVAAFTLGALWYSPMLLGKAWVAANGLTAEKIESMRASASRAYTVSFLCNLVMAGALCVLLRRIGVVSWLTGAKLGALVGLGFAATLGLAANMYSDRKLSAWAIDAAYQVAYLVLMGAILAAWR
jgi:cell division inhibitor SulA